MNTNELQSYHAKLATEDRNQTQGPSYLIHGIQITPEELQEFIDYVYSFYNVVDGLYPVVGCSKNKIQLATVEYLHKCDTYPRLEWGDGDSVDRERVRDIMFEMFPAISYQTRTLKRV